ncbi:MAG: SDR family oxidoreductase [Candidatus Scalindua sp.]|nr:SDR family oxidoreductase [Candidatus Scalindua sp.]
MKILITGGFGYLGGRLSQFLSNMDQYQILIASRSSREIPVWAPNAEIVSIDWKNDQLLDQLTNQVEIIVHMAGMNAQDCAVHPIEALEVNGIATARLIQSAIRQGVKRFIYLSTAHVYNSPLTGIITEKDCLNNLHSYATSHRAGEDVLRSAHQRKEIEGVVIRLSNAYGPPTHADADCWMLLVNDLCHQVVTTKRMVLRSSGLQLRDFITLSDVCSAVEHLLKLPLEGLNDGLYNVGGSVARVINMAETIQVRCLKGLGFKPEIIYPDPVKKEASLSLDYCTNKLLATGFSIRNDRLSEIDSTLCFCNEFFGDAL